MKKIVGAALFVFWAAVTAIIIAGLVFYQDSKINAPALPPSGSGASILSLEEIAKHSAVSDCWLLINNKVYNITSYLSIHPGGLQAIAPYCGKEASQAFATKDTSNPHSANANNLLAVYYVGDLNQKVGILPALDIKPPPAQNTIIPSPAASPIISAPALASGNPVILNSQEITKHNMAKDCWLIINNKIYNVTNYLGSHPGGTAAIFPYCGKEATQVFNGSPHPHSPNANTFLAAYFIGNLNQTIGAAQIQQKTQTTSQITPPGRDNGEEDGD